jgi:hypothetical protein
MLVDIFSIDLDVDLYTGLEVKYGLSGASLSA